MKLLKIIILSCISFTFPQTGHSQFVSTPPADSSQQNTTSPAGLNHPIDYLDFKNTDLKDVLRALAVKYNLNIFVEDNVQVPVTLLTANGFELRQREGVFLVDFGADYSAGNQNERSPRGLRLWVEVKDSLVSLEVTQV